MRILKIRFKNLNSLAGEWEIDLTDPVYTSDGIFAITGPTGAGKTTILDAICLALYGKTPRLDRVVKSTNEIMSRRTGECFAEVTFETPAGRFTCHWSQHKARKKPGGELQAPKHEIFDAHTGKVLDTKLRAVADLIETATGMDFDRFTRSMLLAQGGFAAFLQAAPDARAPILEQITGTEVYSQISIKVHERWHEEHRILETLNAQIQGLQMLGEDEAAALNASLGSKKEQEAALAHEIEMGSEALVWLKGVSSLEADLAANVERQRILDERRQAMAPDVTRLERAQKALEIAVDHALLISLRSDQQRDRQALDECGVNVAGLTTEKSDADEVVKGAVAELEYRKARQDAERETIRRVRDLDTRIAAYEPQIGGATQAVAKVGKELAAVETTQSRNVAALVQAKEGLAAAQAFLAANEVDEGLVEQLAGIRRDIDALRACDAGFSMASRAVEDAEITVTNTARAFSECDCAAAARRRDLAASSESVRELSESLQQALGGRELSDWTAGLIQANDRVTRIGLLLAAIKERDAACASANACAEQERTLIVDRHKLSTDTAAMTLQRDASVREVQLLDTQRIFAAKVRDYETDRLQLADDAACPLCGSLSHPYAEGNVPSVDEAEKEYQEANARLAQFEKRLGALNVEAAQVGARLEQAVKDHQTYLEHHEAALARTADLASALKLEIGVPEQELALEGSLRQAVADAKGTADVIEAAQKIGKDIDSGRALLEKAQAAWANAEKDVQAAGHAKQTAETERQRLQDECKKSLDLFETARSTLLRNLSPYGIASLPAEDLDGVLRGLNARRDAWQAQSRRRADLEQEAVRLDDKVNRYDSDISRLRADLLGRKVEHERLAEEQDGLRAQRTELFGQRSPDAEEAAMAASVAEAETARETASSSLSSVIERLSGATQQAKSLAGAIGDREKRLEAAAESFGNRLSSSGFTGEADYDDACLPEEKRSELQNAKEDLERERTQTAGRLRDAAAQLDAERKKAVTSEPREALESAIHGKGEKLKALSAEIAAIHFQIQQDADQREKRSDMRDAFDVRKKECQRWDSLHGLIGSEDGKKFRNFAQGITFEIMIRHANRQLARMTDRYLLTRDSAQPLDLSVIDNYQAGEIRSAKNLSGGESFLVSLALALGLSQMSSRKVRIDSLFLDEGFGTLDDDALDTALNTLAELRRDGKMIGVISHVAALKERITTQIQVTPQSGGRSVISGPGCRRGEA